MQNIIQFPRAMPAGGDVQSGNPAERLPGSSGTPPIESIWSAIASLSHALDQVRTLCETVPEGPIRAQLEAERTRLIVGLFAARLSVAQLSERLAANSAGTKVTRQR